ncbi:glucose dehydrogenase [fad, quinone]-like isoform x5 [Plakobranchus ocellatus]|uniref:Glucose dehydrogenase [fad, quinone]-like isoform x5 n=1 Tax=Plakobranchus ocellatus TaxID=259542 RepID=A0AAV4CNL7_9GAST|nr:glucose dehydrogenase [fad, quinone]-like isoform x5 [Plakobranchus ocellatus]
MVFFIDGHKKYYKDLVDPIAGDDNDCADDGDDVDDDYDDENDDDDDDDDDEDDDDDDDDNHLLIGAILSSTLYPKTKPSPRRPAVESDGGNGKRSDPNLNLLPSTSSSSLNIRQPNLLSKVLLSDIEHLARSERVGNGKRSDPNLNLLPSTSSSSLNIRQPNLLSKVLLSDIEHLARSEREKSWSKPVQSYSPPYYADDYEEEGSLGALRTDDRIEAEDNSCQMRLELALAEMADLKKYIATLEKMLQVRASDMA